METCKGLCKEGSKCLKLRQATGRGCCPTTEDCDAGPDHEVAGETIRGSRTGIGVRGALPGFWTSNLGSGLRLATEPHSLVGSIRSGILAEALGLSRPGGMHLVAVTYAPTEKRLHWPGFWMASGFGFALWCSAVSPGAVTHVAEHHPSRGQMWQGRMALWVSSVPLCGAPDACAYQPRRVLSMGELVVRRPSRSLISALGTPVGAQWCKGVKSGLARQGPPARRNTDQGVYPRPQAMLVKAGTEQLVAGPAVPPPWLGLASATRPRRGMQQWPQLLILPNVACLKRTDHFLCGATVFHLAFGDSEERVAMPLGTLRRGAAFWIHAGSMVRRAACFSMACNGEPI